MERYLQAKSVHIFAWPFQVNGKAEDFRDKIEKAGYRKKPMDCSSMTVGNGVTEREWQDAYMLNQYLSVAAREVFVNKADKVCSVYQLPKEKLIGLDYYIDAVWAENQHRKYYLPLEQVELHVYQCGVGILFLQMLNEAEDSTIEDIKRINDFGRRISLPFLLEKEDSSAHWEYNIVAKQLGIVKREPGKKAKVLKSNIVDYADLNKSFYEKKGTNGKQLLACAPFLMDLLNGSPLGEQAAGVIAVTDISLHTDDRMYTMALIRDGKLSKEIESGEWKQTEQEKFYSIIYVDAKAASCTDEEMRTRLLSEAVYPRWLGWGTLYAATNYSMLCITTDWEGINASVARPFIKEYKYIISLVIAQKMGIERYAIETAKLAESADKGSFSNRKIKELFQLQRKYITFKNQMLVIEASCQEQGIELYQMLQKQMLIEQEKEQLDSLLTCMYEMADVSRSRKTEITAIWISIIALAVSIVALSPIMNFIEKVMDLS